MSADNIATISQALEWLKKNRPVPGSSSIASSKYWGELFDVLEFILKRLAESEK